MQAAICTPVILGITKDTRQNCLLYFSANVGFSVKKSFQGIRKGKHLDHSVPCVQVEQGTWRITDYFFLCSGFQGKREVIHQDVIQGKAQPSNSAPE